MARAAGDYWNETRTLDGLARLALAEGELAEATRLLETCVDVAREMGDVWTVAAVSNTLGDVARTKGDYSRAKRLYEESLVRFGTLGNDGQPLTLRFNHEWLARRGMSGWFVIESPPGIGSSLWRPLDSGWVGHTSQVGA